MTTKATNATSKDGYDRYGRRMHRASMDSVLRTVRGMNRAIDENWNLIDDHLDMKDPKAEELKTVIRALKNKLCHLNRLFDD